MKDVLCPRPERSRKKSETAQSALIIAASDCAIQFATPQARRWLRTFFGRPLQRGFLPREICGWLAAGKTRGKKQALAASADDVHLFVRQQKPEIKNAIMLILQRIPDRLGAADRKHGRLTSREEEVLKWVGHAKSDAEIASILGISPRTVGKHLERIYPKLGVENRTAAATQVTPEQASPTSGGS